MRKFIFTILMVVITLVSANAQVSITDRFGNIKIAQQGNEPWRIQGTTTSATSNTQNIYQTGNVGVGDFSSTTGTEKLDVNGNVRIRSMVNGTTDATYNRTVVNKDNGTLGYAVGSPLVNAKIIKYVLTKNGDDADWVKYYDTKIDASKYDLLILSVRFKDLNISASSNNLAFLAFTCDVRNTTIGSATHKFEIDYATAGLTFPSRTGTWELVVAVIPKGQVVTVTQTINVTDAAASAPPGL